MYNAQNQGVNGEWVTPSNYNRFVELERQRIENARNEALIARQMVTERNLIGDRTTTEMLQVFFPNATAQDVVNARLNNPDNNLNMMADLERFR